MKPWARAARRVPVLLLLGTGCIGPGVHVNDTALRITDLEGRPMARVPLEVEALPFRYGDEDRAGPWPVAARVLSEPDGRVTLPRKTRLRPYFAPSPHESPPGSLQRLVLRPSGRAPLRLFLGYADRVRAAQIAWDGQSDARILRYAFDGRQTPEIEQFWTACTGPVGPAAGLGPHVRRALVEAGRAVGAQLLPGGAHPHDLALAFELSDREGRRRVTVELESAGGREVPGFLEPSPPQGGGLAP